MPKSKRAKVVHMSKTTKKGKELTLKLYANIQECIPKYPYIYVFSVHNMRNTYLKDVRTQLSDSRLFFGKTKVMAVALGLTSESEPYPQTSLLSPHLRGSVGLLFSPRPPSVILSYFSTFVPLDFARAGSTASRTFSLPSGTLHSRGGEISAEEDVPLAHSVEPNLRKLGLPTRLVKGKVELDGDFVVCREGEVLGSGQTTLLKMFGIAMAEFRFSHDDRLTQ
ncbi:MAG: mRNA turnover 4 [Alectoria sarmentosa]|nr:MAG: mRNA turnover 4 [Alectoria sarmentosa]